MVQLPQISTEQQLERLIYIRMFSEGDYPCSKPAKYNLHYLKCSIQEKDMHLIAYQKNKEKKEKH